MTDNAKQRITSAFDATTRAYDVVEGLDLGGKRALITGGAGGIGLEIVRALAKAGADIVIADVDRTQLAKAKDLTAAEFPKAKIETHHMDLAALSSVRTFARNFNAAGGVLDILINNAGVMAVPLGRTVDGHERHLGINHLGHFALTLDLVPALRAGGGARVICVSSIGHRRSDIIYDDPDYRTRKYDRWEAYGQSKTACSLFAVALTERFADDGIFANAVNPGGSMTGLQRYLSRDELLKLRWIDEDGAVNPRWRSPAQCAATTTWLATSPDLEKIGGRYFEECAEAEPFRPDLVMAGVHDYALSPENASRMWDLSEKLIAG